MYGLSVATLILSSGAVLRRHWHPEVCLLAIGKLSGHKGTQTVPLPPPFLLENAVFCHASLHVGRACFTLAGCRLRSLEMRVLAPLCERILLLLLRIMLQMMPIASLRLSGLCIMGLHCERAWSRALRRLVQSPVPLLDWHQPKRFRIA